MGKTTIEVEKETRTRLKVWKAAREMTYDEAIARLLDRSESLSQFEIEPVPGFEPPIGSGLEFLRGEGRSEAVEEEPRGAQTDG